MFEHPTIAELAALLEDDTPPTPGTEVGPLAHACADREEERLPLSFAQERLWFLEQLEPGQSIYNIPAAVRMTGPLHMTGFRDAITEVVRRHESLRTVFPIVGVESVQEIQPASPVYCALVDLRSVARDTIERVALEEARRPFDLVQGPLLRVTVVRRGEDEHIVLFSIHHIAGDGWSVGVLIRELSTLYDAFLKGRPSPLVELPMQYADFALWQRRWHEGPGYKQHLKYWTTQLAGLSAIPDIPSDRPRPRVESLRASTATFTLPRPLSHALRELSQQKQATLFMTLLTGLKTLVYQYTGSDDVVVGTDIANRHHAGVEDLIGFFVNILVLRSNLSGNPSFEEALGRVRQVTQDAYAHQDLPFDRLAEELQPERHRWRPPFFQVLFVMQNAGTEPLVLPGLQIGAVDVREDRARFDLAIFVSESDGELSFRWVYKTDLYHRSTIERMARQLAVVLTRATENPGTRLKAFDLRTYEEIAEQAAREKGGLEKKRASRRRVVSPDLSN